MPSVWRNLRFQPVLKGPHVKQAQLTFRRRWSHEAQHPLKCIEGARDSKFEWSHELLNGQCTFWCDHRPHSAESITDPKNEIRWLGYSTIICRSFYLPREFSSIVTTSVYIPPQADTSLAFPNLHDVLSGYNNKHPDAAFIIAGDFNKANLKKVMPNFHQHISCPTRGLNTLDHCYTPLKNAYKAHSLPNRIMPPFSSHRNTNKGSFMNRRWRGKWRAGPPTLKLCYRRLLMTSTGTCSGRVHLTSANSRM